MVWIKFSLCLLIILFAGTNLARYADLISEKTGLGRLWIGLVLIAAITSAPELVTGISSAIFVGLPDLALGTLLGSCIFNLSILASLDIVSRRRPVLSRASSRHVVSAGFNIALLAFTALGIIASERLPGLKLGWVGIPSIILVAIYLLGVRYILVIERNHKAVQSNDSVAGLPPTYVVWLKFALSAATIIATGIWLSFIGDEITGAYSWNASFVGSLFLAFCTSMPEVVVTLSALRLGAVDMAIGDIMGANMLDVANIFLVDLFFIRAPLLSRVSGVHIMTTLVAIVMTILVVIGLKFPQRRKTFVFISWYGLALIGLYLTGAFILYASGLGLN